jgi:hypothetical protein
MLEQWILDHIEPLSPAPLIILRDPQRMIQLVAGQTADDGLYLQLYQRVHDLLGQTCLLYIGDCKMAALGTRGQIA